MAFTRVAQQSTCHKGSLGSTEALRNLQRVVRKVRHALVISHCYDDLRRQSAFPSLNSVTPIDSISDEKSDQKKTQRLKQISPKLVDFLPPSVEYLESENDTASASYAEDSFSPDKIDNSHCHETGNICWDSALAELYNLTEESQHTDSWLKPLLDVPQLGLQSLATILHAFEQSLDTWVTGKFVWVKERMGQVSSRSNWMISWAFKRYASTKDSRVRALLYDLLDEMGQLHVLQEYISAYINEKFVETRCRLSEIVCRLSCAFGFGWFFEWPKGQPPRNSTWPWADVKPSLLVLWGVCWMFYPPQAFQNPGHQQHRHPQPLRDRIDGGPLLDSGQYAIMNQFDPYRFDSQLRLQNPTLPRQRFPASVRPEPINPDSFTCAPIFTHSHPYNFSHMAPEQSRSYRVAASNLASIRPSPSSAALHNNDVELSRDWNSNWTVMSLNPNPLSSSANFAAQTRPHTRHPHHPHATPQQQLYKDSRSPSKASVGMDSSQSHFDIQSYPNLDNMGSLDARPYPTNDQTFEYTQHQDIAQDDFNKQDHANYADPGEALTENNEYTAQMTAEDGAAETSLDLPGADDKSEADSTTTPGKIKPVVRPHREIVRDATGRFYCSWPGCTEEIKDFHRRCEWSKHMDKHDRPYKCPAEGCEKLPGFTYSGGLLRHEREVHGKHGGPRRQLNCPHKNCKRHQGKGFSRQENLNEHLRRVHTGTDIDANAKDDTEEENEGQVGQKRKRAGNDDELREEMKRLKAENAELKRQVENQNRQSTEMARQIFQLQQNQQNQLSQILQSAAANGRTRMAPAAQMI